MQGHSSSSSALLIVHPCMLLLFDVPPLFVHSPPLPLPHTTTFSFRSTSCPVLAFPAKAVAPGMVSAAAKSTWGQIANWPAQKCALNIQHRHDFSHLSQLCRFWVCCLSVIIKRVKL
jgi:hypothetical protein